MINTFFADNTISTKNNGGCEFDSQKKLFLPHLLNGMVGLICWAGSHGQVGRALFFSIGGMLRD